MLEDYCRGLGRHAGEANRSRMRYEIYTYIYIYIDLGEIYMA